MTLALITFADAFGPVLIIAVLAWIVWLCLRTINERSRQKEGEAHPGGEGQGEMILSNAQLLRRTLEKAMNQSTVTAAFLLILETLKADERVVVMDHIKAKYCEGCGEKQLTSRCQCRNEE